MNEEEEQYTFGNGGFVHYYNVMDQRRVEAPSELEFDATVLIYELMLKYDNYRIFF